MRHHLATRLTATIASVMFGFLLPAPLTLLAAGLIQGDPGMMMRTTLGHTNLVLAYRFGAPFALAFGLGLAAFGFAQCRRLTDVPRHLPWHVGFLVLGGAFGSCALIAAQVAFGGGLFSMTDILLLLFMGGASGALAALPVSMCWYGAARNRASATRQVEECDDETDPTHTVVGI